MNSENRQFQLLGHILRDTKGLTFFPYRPELPIDQAIDVSPHPDPQPHINAIRYAYSLGMLMQQLHTLEFLLRIYLAKLPDASPLGIPHGTDIYTLPVGTKVPASDISNYAQLRKLIVAFNNVAKSDRIDESLVALRDALAHGRVSMKADGDTNRLIKFGKEDASGNVVVDFNVEMTTEWLREQVDRVGKAANSVVKALQSIGANTQSVPV